jgi:hypothetical protein
MEKRRTTNKELDKIGIAVLRASLLRDDEIERVIDDPYLFSSIKRRIRQEPVAKKAVARFTDFLNVKKIAGSLSIAVVAVTVFGLVSLKYLNQPAAETVRVLPPHASTNLPVAVIPNDKVSTPELAPAAVQPKRIYQAEPAVVKTHSPRRMSTETVAQPENESRTMEFYPLAGTAPDSLGEGRIVRVELPRASLVALGANLPPDSGKPLVKTDLLVGQDGVPRAIRLVD